MDHRKSTLYKNHKTNLIELNARNKIIINTAKYTND